MYSPQSLGTVIVQRAVCSCSKWGPPDTRGELALMIPIAPIAANPKILLPLMIFSSLEFIGPFTAFLWTRAPPLAARNL